MTKIICWFLGHVWLPIIITKEDWHAYEDVGPNGGLTMAYAPGKGSGDDENYVREFKSRHCAYCNKTEWL